MIEKYTSKNKERSEKWQERDNTKGLADGPPIPDHFVLTVKDDPYLALLQQHHANDGIDRNVQLPSK